MRNGDDRAIWRNLTHMFPHPYSPADADRWCWSQASMLVLDHCGFVLEGVSCARVVKDGELIDRVIHALVKVVER